MATESDRMACPECGETRFSWIVEMVQFGDVHRYKRHEDGETTVSYDEESLSGGDIVGSDVKENGVYCTTCDDFVDEDDLVPAED